MSIIDGPRIVTSGLVLNLDAANTKSYPGSGTSWTDLSGNNNTGTLTNGPTFSSANNGQIVFDGTNDYVNITVGPTSPLKITNNITVSVWFYNSSWKESNIIQGGGYGFIFWTGTSIYGAAYDGKIIWGKQQTTNQVISNNTYSGLLNVWYNIVGTYNGTTLRLYYNGVLDKEQNNSFTFDVSECTIGTGIDGTFNGRISNVNVFNRVLTQSEIQQNFNALRGRFGV